MAKSGGSTIRISRKGMVVWIGLMLFVAVWMFVLGILVGRGMAPVNLQAGKLEQELAALKAKVLRQEKATVEAKAAGKDGAKTELGFYEALKDPSAQKRFAPIAKPKPAEKPASATPSATVTRPVPKPAPKTVQPKAKPKQAVTPKTKSAAVTKPKPAVVSKPKAAAPDTGRYTIQVAALKEVRGAEKLVGELRKKGFRAYQIRTDLSGKGVWYRVRVGAFTQRDQAAKMAARLKTQRYGAMVVSTR